MKTPEQKKRYAQAERERWLARKAEGIALLGGKCIRCGSIQDLEFDHIDRNTKLFNPNKGTRKYDAWLKEVKKCQLLCKACHKEKSHESGDTGFQQRYGNIEHGTPWMYNKYKCRCTSCKEAWSIYRREWRRKRKEDGFKPS